MGVFELLFVYQNSPVIKDNPQSLTTKIVLNFLTLVIVFLAVFSSIITLVTTLRSKRSTYSLQEMNIINFMSFTSLVFILSFPYFLVLT
jgi:hypothetical protein